MKKVFLLALCGFSALCIYANDPHHQAVKEANEICNAYGKKSVPSNSRDAHGTINYGNSTENQNLGTRNYYKGSGNVNANGGVVSGGAEGSFNRDGEQKNTTNTSNTSGSFHYKCE